ncbi:hypothetical protein EV360DRAFT_81505 [Lentinula raphanica]|nr:hypothetical protein EV360DRAFT_81505 [Lentinula raphanica]
MLLPSLPLKTTLSFLRRLFVASCLLRVAVVAAPTDKNLAQAAASTGSDELPEPFEEEIFLVEYADGKASLRVGDTIFCSVDPRGSVTLRESYIGIARFKNSTTRKDDFEVIRTLAETGHASGFATTLNNWPTIGEPRKLDPQMDEILGCWRHIDWVMYFMFTQPSGTSKRKSKHLITESTLKVWKEMKTKKFRELFGIRTATTGNDDENAKGDESSSGLTDVDIFLYEFFDKKGRVTGTVMLAIGPKSETFGWKADLQVYRDKGWSPQTTLIGQAKFPNPHTRDTALNNARNTAAEAVKERIRRIPVNQAPGVGVPKYMDFWDYLDTFVSKLAEHIDSATRDKYRRVRSKRVHELEAYKSKELTRKRIDRARKKDSMKKVDAQRRSVLER